MLEHVEERSAGRKAGGARALVTVSLVDGPCAGTHAEIKAFSADCWQRLGPREQAWCRYVKDLLRPGVFVWSGETLTSGELASRLAADKRNTYGYSEGA